MSNEGYIILARALLDSEVFANEIMLKVWIWLLLKANWKDKFAIVKIGAGSSTVPLKRGQLIFGRFTAENELNLNGNSIYKKIKRLEEIGNITLESNSHYTIITICNYEQWQDVRSYEITATEQPPNSHVTTAEQPRNTPKERNTLKERNISLVDFDNFWNLYDKKRGRPKSLVLWEKLSDDDRNKIMAHVPKYKLETPDKKFRKDPASYLHQQAWENEVIIPQVQTEKTIDDIRKHYNHEWQKLLPTLKTRIFYDRGEEMITNRFKQIFGTCVKMCVKFPVFIEKEQLTAEQLIQLYDEGIKMRCPNFIWEYMDKILDDGLLKFHPSVYKCIRSEMQTREIAKL